MERVITRLSHNPLVKARQMCWITQKEMADSLGWSTAKVSVLERDAALGELSDKRMEELAKYIGMLYGRGREEAEKFYREYTQKRKEREDALLKKKGA